MKKVKIKTYKEKMIFSVSLAGMYSFVKLFKKADGISSYITSNNNFKISSFTFMNFR